MTNPTSHQFYEYEDITRRIASAGISAAEVGSVLQASFRYYAMVGVMANLTPDEKKRTERDRELHPGLLVRDAPDSSRDFQNRVTFIVKITGLDHRKVRHVLIHQRLHHWEEAVLTDDELDRALVNAHTREFSRDEQHRVAILRDAYRQMVGELPARWNVLVFLASDVMSDPRELCRCRTIFLTPEQLAGSFPEAFATFLDEAERTIEGVSLTAQSRNVIFRLIASRSFLDIFEQRWNSVEVTPASRA